MKPNKTTHGRRSDFADPRLLCDGADLVDESIRISKFFPAGLEDRALRRRLELVRPRQAHGRSATGEGGEFVTRALGVLRSNWRCFLLLLLVCISVPCIHQSQSACSASTSTREEADYTLTHSFNRHTHTSTHSEENVPRQWARPPKKLDTARFYVMRVRCITLCGLKP